MSAIAVSVLRWWCPSGRSRWFTSRAPPVAAAGAARMSRSHTPPRPRRRRSQRHLPATIRFRRSASAYPSGGNPYAADIFAPQRVRSLRRCRRSRRGRSPSSSDRSGSCAPRRRRAGGPTGARGRPDRRSHDFVAEQGDGERIGGRGIVGLDDVEVAVTRKIGPLSPAASGAGPRPRGEAAGRPVARRPGPQTPRTARARPSGRPSARSPREPDLEAPGKTALPSVGMRKLAVDPMASGARVQMSRRPSPVKSTANSRKLDGMNWVWPMAPAQDPTIARGVTSPSSKISSAASSSSRKSRRGTARTRGSPASGWSRTSPGPRHNPIRGPRSP